MADNLTSEQRSACMRAVHGSNTSPELAVRKLLHTMGFRYALHLDRLPGKPDIVLVSRRKIIFVHGCFWHKHRCRHGMKSPSTNETYWEQKRQRNKARDRKITQALRKNGWSVLVVWECWTREPIKLANKLAEFVSSGATDSTAEQQKIRAQR